MARKRVTELINEVRNHPAVFGYYLRDEPTPSFFPGLAAVSSVVKELHPGAWPYINLFPNYADAGQLGTATYDEYVEKFIEACKPPILSYDHYALFEGGGFRGEYFANLESVRRAAMKHKLAVLANRASLGCLNFREPTPTDMRFQVYTSLAYGARGLAYFKYFTPAVGNFRGGPIDQFGNETPMWHVMRHVNLQIGKLAPTLLKLTVGPRLPFRQRPGRLHGPDDKSLVKAMAGPMLVGDFTHADGSRYIMIVNKDFTGSVVCSPAISRSRSKLEFVSAFGRHVNSVRRRVHLARAGARRADENHAVEKGARGLHASHCDRRRPRAAADADHGRRPQVLCRSRRQAAAWTGPSKRLRRTASTASASSAAIRSTR